MSRVFLHGIKKFLIFFTTQGVKNEKSCDMSSRGGRKSLLRMGGPRRGRRNYRLNSVGYSPDRLFCFFRGGMDGWQKSIIAPFQPFFVTDDKL